MFSLVTQPWAQEVKRLLERGGLGKLLAVHADAFFAKGRAGSADLGRRRREEYPPTRHQRVEAKREWDNVGVYPITLVHWLTGLEFRTVYGVTANYFFREHQGQDVEDFGLLCGTLEGGVPVSVSAGRYGWSTHPAGGTNRVVLVGTERTVTADANHPRLEVYSDEPPWTPPRVHPEDPMGFWSSTQAESGLKPKRTWVPAAAPGPSDASYFLDCLDAGRDSDVSAAEAALATGIRHVIVTHPEFPQQDMALEDQVALARQGAFLERCFTTPFTGKYDWDVMVANIRATGPGQTIVTTDLGQPANPPVEDGLALMADALHGAGFTDEEITTMIVTNSRLLAGVTQ
jgi:hypothetical protein